MSPRGPATILHARVCANAGGGPDKTILRSSAYLDPARYRMVAAYFVPHASRHTDDLQRQARARGCTWVAIPERGPIDARAIRAMLDLCRREGVDVWHGHDYKSDALGLLLARFHPMKLVTTAHGFTDETWRTRLYRRIDQVAMRWYDHVIAVSPPLVEHCLRHGIAPERLSYVPNGIEAGQYRRRVTQRAARRQLGIHEDHAHHLLTVGRLSAEKGVNRSLEAVRALRHRDVAVVLHVVGDGPESDALKRRARMLGVADAVRWWGWQGDTRRWYEAADVLLLPSYTEGLPNVLLEAMSLGLAVAAADVGGVRDVLDAGRCGVLLPGGAPVSGRSWAGALAALLDDRAHLAHLVRLARQRVAERFTFQRRMAAVQAVYDRVLGSEVRSAAFEAPTGALRRGRAA